MIDLIKILVCFICGSFLLIYLALRKQYSYFKDRGVLHDKPVFFFGNLKKFYRTKTLYDIVQEYYMKFKKKARFVGFYFFLSKTIILLDPDLIQHICVKDFANFPGRGTYYNKKDDPISAVMLFLEGEHWKNLRTKLTPTFTSGKIKSMFTTVVDVADQLINVLEDERKSADMNIGIDFADLMSRYTTDVIGSVAFGLECNRLKEPTSKFSKTCEKIGYFKHSMPVVSLMNTFPNLARKFRMKLFPKEISDFFFQIVRDTVEYREKTGIQRKDYLNILMELRKSETSDALTMEEMTAQTFLLFVAGFETSSSVMSFCLYELALNPDIQEKARTEMNEVMAQHDGKLTYEAVKEMKYLLHCMYETTRKYSVVPVIVRKAAKDYILPNTNHVIEKGTTVVLPIDALHYDPDIYPSPQRFDPNRFSTEEIAKRHPMAYMGFGKGPRACIGYRFAYMQIIIGLYMMLKNYRFSPTKETQIPMKYKLNKHFRDAERGVYLKIEKL
ncbi:probable cytochrome P450 6a13 [Teleopsis dalmanni]|uniref:probable cytochrome P450 6a13 n=1 Tax=Teleopsis dalmanni TaxID=139649 RepID=UPI0018CEF315|nr:probable cytochrome P450 6a13 [Teleopsis dalmanni]